MKYDQDNQNGEWRQNGAGQWTREQPKRDKRFDFNAFLGPESLSDRVTDALDGKDLLDEEAYGSPAPDYVPRRASGGERRGRHEAPSSEPEEDETFDDGLDTRRFDENGSIRRPVPPRGPVQQPSDFRQEGAPRVNANDPPPRPKVVVADPAPRVVVTPERQYGDREPAERGGRGKGGGKAMKWLIALLISLAVIALIGVAAFSLLPGLMGGTDPLASPAPNAGGQQMLPTQVPATPVPTPAVTPPPAIHYTVTVTAGSGGSVTPGGAVSVEEGANATFTITPDVGYELGQLLIDGSPVSVQSSYTFYSVERDHTLYAVFQQIQAPPVEETAEPTTEPTAEPQTEVTPEPQTGTGPDPILPPQGEGV